MRNPLIFTRSERRAVIVLALVALACVAGLIFFGESPQAESPATDESRVSVVRDARSIPHDVHPTAVIKTFDPNTVDSVTLVQIGISPRRVHTFMRYRAAGARFAQPQDITRCYSFSDDDIDLLMPLIRIAPEYQHSSSYTRSKYPIQESYQADDHKSSTDYPSNSVRYQSNKFTTLTRVDINTADTSILKRIPGIGDAISSMIINLREKFGGFTSLSQLSQIHQLTPEHMEWFTLADTVPFRRIQINKASFKTLVSHPYISKDQANGILHYIRIYGPIKDVKALSSTALFTQEELVALTPYLEF